MDKSDKDFQRASDYMGWVGIKGGQKQRDGAISNGKARVKGISCEELGDFKGQNPGRREERVNIRKVLGPLVELRWIFKIGKVGGWEVPKSKSIEQSRA